MTEIANQQALPKPNDAAQHPPEAEQLHQMNVDPLQLYADAARRGQEVPLPAGGSPAQANAQIEALRTALGKWAEKNLASPESAAASDSFKAGMAKFEQRAAANGLSQEEVLKTYQQISRLTQTDIVLAQEAMQGVAGTVKVRQGANMTCNVSDVQARANAFFPAESTRLVADAVLKGQYRDHDGTVVKVDVKKMSELDGRSLYDKIWQTTAVDLYYARENARTGHDIHYERHEPKNPLDTGERLVDYSKHPPEEKPFKGLPAAAIAEINNAISGRNETDVVLVHSNANPEIIGSGPGLAGVAVIHSEKELADKLQQLKQNHKLPVIVCEYNATEPFYTDDGSAVVPAEMHQGGHVVVVSDYDPQSKRMSIDNSAGHDHEMSNSVSVHDLNIAMQMPTAAEKGVEAYVNKLRTENTLPGQSQQAVKPTEQFVNEVQSLRLQFSNGKMSEEMAQYKLQQYISEAVQRKASGRLSEKQESLEMQEIENTIGNLSLEARVRCYRSEHQSKLIDDKEYFVKLGELEAMQKGFADSPGYKSNPTMLGDSRSFYYELARSYAELPPGMSVSNEEALAIMKRRHLGL